MSTEQLDMQTTIVRSCKVAADLICQLEAEGKKFNERTMVFLAALALETYEMSDAEFHEGLQLMPGVIEEIRVGLRILDEALKDDADES